MDVSLHTLQKWFLLAFLVSTLGAFAQDNPPFGENDDGILLEKSVLLKVADSSADVSYLTAKGMPIFPNINRVRFYQNKKKWETLNRYEGKADVEDFSEVLTDYVSSFGIDNFFKNLDLIWKLGRIRQIQQDTAQALFYYELAIKHTRDQRAPRLAYDSLMAPDKSEWVNLDTYYRLLELRKKIDPLIPPKGILQNMGKAINSDAADYAPYMHPSDSLLIFTSRRGNPDLIDPFVSQEEDLYFAVKDFMTGQWQDSEKFDATINSSFHEGSACLSRDGKTLFFTRCNADDTFGDCDLYTATYHNGKWVDITHLPPWVNSGNWDSQPNISEDGKILFFASNRRYGFGGMDIYYTVKKDDGDWSKAQNLGPMINTPNDEVSPFFHSINRTLYFGSNGQIKNYGGFDIFKARWLGEQWEDPKNVGPLVNTRVNEYYFSIDQKAHNIFYSSSKRGEGEIEFQDFDLYSFPMPMESRPDAVTKLTGVLLDSITGNPLIGMVMVIDLDEGVEIAPKRINDRGFFEFDLINQKKYRIYVLGENFLTIRNDIILDGDTTFSIITKSINSNKPLVFESLEFGSNSYKLEGTVKPKLDYIVKFLQRYPMYKIHIEGHTDSDGDHNYNKKLSLQRAQQIQAYILKEGRFPSSRVFANGFGEERPLHPNDSDVNKNKNRRVEFRLEWDETYAGDKFLPMEDELMFDDEFLDDDDYDPVEFLEEFDMLDDIEGFDLDEWDANLDDDLLDLDKELEDDMEDFLIDDDN